MHVRNDIVLQTKSFTSIYEIFGPNTVKNRAFKGSSRANRSNKTGKKTRNTSLRSKDPDNDTTKSNDITAFVTCEKYLNLNRNSSLMSDFRSTSTLFYDLDSLTFRHSCADLSGVSYMNCHQSNTNISHPTSPNGFSATSEAIVQECETNIKPTLIPRDSIEINTAKVEKCFPNDPEFSSEIFLKDDEFDVPVKNISNSQLKRNQKYWSYAKYRTEYTNPSRQDKKSKKKDRTRQIEDPCPCQLFSYTCPCNDEKSLTGLKNVKSLTDQITSTTNIKEDRKEKNPFSFCKKKNHKTKEKLNIPMDDKPTSTTCFIDNYVDSVEKSEQALNYSDKYDISQPVKNHTVSVDKSNSSCKKRRILVCPNCKEKVELTSRLQSEEEESIIYADSTHQTKDPPHPGQSIYTYKTSIRKQTQDKLKEKDTCLHTPRCELVPLCQILPSDNIYANYKTITKNDTLDKSPKNSPRIIRVTKACRHHPPCTVAPSCQRANILRNNCEFIPPCLHRPRCVNLPLCVPNSKNINYDELKSVDDSENSECPHIPRCKYVPECRQVYSNQMSNQVNIARMPNNYGIFQPLTTYPNIKSPNVPQTFSPTQIHPTGYLPDCDVSRSNKSCQCVTIDIPCKPSVSNIQDCVSSEAVVFIRDVGCQFRSKFASQRDSFRSTKSSTVFDRGNAYTNVHTLRYEDKFTNAMAKLEMSTSSLSLTSNYMEMPKDSYPRSSGFDPKPMKSPLIAYATKHYNDINIGHIVPIKSRSSYSKGCSLNCSKYRKMLKIKRKRKKRNDYQMFSYRKPVYTN